MQFDAQKGFMRLPVKASKSFNNIHQQTNITENEEVSILNKCSYCKYWK